MSAFTKSNLAPGPRGKILETVLQERLRHKARKRGNPGTRTVRMEVEEVSVLGQESSFTLKWS